MSIKPIRLSGQAKEQLIRLKTRTGIAGWNILYRRASCLSFQQPTPPTPVEIAADSGVEMEGQVVGGEAHELCLALLKDRFSLDGLEPSDQVLTRQFRLHLHWGIGDVPIPHMIKVIGDLVGLVTRVYPADIAGLGTNGTD
jgi:DNA sulfur modification protein DndE